MTRSTCSRRPNQAPSWGFRWEELAAAASRAAGGGLLPLGTETGTYTYDVVQADQFSLFVQRDGNKSECPLCLIRVATRVKIKCMEMEDAWIAQPITHLFPRAWTAYRNPLPGINLVCKQISPVIGGNYKESSYPVAVFEWKIENTGKTAAKIGLMFTFQNGNGSANDEAGGNRNEPFSIKLPHSEIVGLICITVIGKKKLMAIMRLRWQGF